MTRRRSRRSEERQRAFLASLFKISLAVGAFGLAAWEAYEVGYKVAQGEVSSLRSQVAAATESAKKEEELAVGARAALAEAQKQAEEYRTLYEQYKPSEDMRDIIALARGRLAEGMEPKRLAFAIRTAQNPHDCEAPSTKRFLVRTPHYRGPITNTSVRLGELLTLSAEGSGGNGGQEQWFDPERPVKLLITPSGGAKDGQVTGLLPIEHAVAVRNSEVHFTVTASTSRGYVDVTSERCDYR